MVRTKTEWMDELATQLEALGTISTATRLTKSLDNAEINSPYIGVVSSNESTQVKDTSDTRYLTNITLFVLTREQDTAIEDIVEDIKELVETIDLGTNIYQTTYVSSQLVAIEDYNEEDGYKFSNTRVDLQVVWSHNFTAASNIEVGLTEPVATAHYKVYSLLSSGSYSSQPLGTNVYPSNTSATISIPASSGSILVGVVTDFPEAEGNFVQDHIDDHFIGMVIDIPTAYVGGQVSLSTSMRLTDNVIEKLRKNVNLGDGYRFVEDGTFFNVSQYTDILSESQTLGTRLNITIRKPLEYTQE